MSELKDTAQDYIRSLRLEYSAGQYWTHYKGGVYKIVAVAVEEDTLEPVIVYESLKHGTVWVRTVKNWNEEVPVMGPARMVSRFKKGAP